MTYKQLAHEINLLTEDQQNKDVTVFVRGVDEFYPVTDRFCFTLPEDNDVLDPEHPFLQI